MPLGIFSHLLKRQSVHYCSPKRQSCRHPNLCKTRTKRGRRVILWGTFDYKLDPRQYTQNTLKQILGTRAPTCFAEWLRSKTTQKIKGILVHLPSVNDAKLILANTSKLIKTSPTIKNVSPDRPLSQRLKSARKITSPPTLQTDKLDLTLLFP